MAHQRTLTLAGWPVRVQEPAGPGPHPVVLMLHGWTGDEESMWVFATRLPKDALLIAPRGLYPAPLGGYGWHATHQRVWPWVDDFRPAIDQLSAWLTVEHFPEADFSRMSVVGFSQGAALACSLALLYPQRVRAIAGLAGFLPDGIEMLLSDKPLDEKPVFLAHGTQDELVPVEKARTAVEMLQRAGAQVTYCEDDVGHKLSLNCFRGLQAFYNGLTC